MKVMQICETFTIPPTSDQNNYAKMRANLLKLKVRNLVVLMPKNAIVVQPQLCNTFIRTPHRNDLQRADVLIEKGVLQKTEMKGDWCFESTIVCGLPVGIASKAGEHFISVTLSSTKSPESEYSYFQYKEEKLLTQ